VYVVLLTANQKKILRFLSTEVGKHHSINDIAKQVHVSPNGTYKILIEFEKEGILVVNRIANIMSYSLDFNNKKTKLVLELAFIPRELDGRIKIRAQDLETLKELTKACILFGSYITIKEKPDDLDVLFVMQHTCFESYKKKLSSVQDVVPIKIQDVIQTPCDLEHNIKKYDPIIIEALRNGVVLWGADLLVEVIERVSRQT
jgi:DNA-binding Lrp family transcriptional regulator